MDGLKELLKKLFFVLLTKRFFITILHKIFMMCWRFKPRILLMHYSAPVLFRPSSNNRPIACQTIYITAIRATDFLIPGKIF